MHEFPSWQGEFGWEVMSWAPLCRRQAKDHDRVIVTSFAGMGPLYEDFAEFRSHGETGRSLTYPKAYRPKGIYHRYGRSARAPYRFDVLLHARGIGRKGSINYRRWSEVLAIAKTEQLPVTFACIGSAADQRIDGLVDLRELGLQLLMDLIAGAKLVVGVSSGLMHLSAACGTDLVVWGDRRTYFSETLEQRYKITWNPLNVKVGWIDADNWHPEPSRIVEAIKEIL